MPYHVYAIKLDRPRLRGNERDYKVSNSRHYQDEGYV